MRPVLSVLTVASSEAQTLEELRREVERWGEAALLDAGAEDYEEVTAWLDRNFYRFES